MYPNGPYDDDPRYDRPWSPASNVDIFTPEPRLAGQAENYLDAVDDDEKDLIEWNEPDDGGETFPPILRRQNEESNWNQNLWPERLVYGKEQWSKSHVKNVYLLNDDDLRDLCYMKIYRGPNWKSRGASEFEYRYLVEEVERRAWEVFGGPRGLAAAQRRAGTSLAERRRRNYEKEQLRRKIEESKKRISKSKKSKKAQMKKKRKAIQKSKNQVPNNSNTSRFDDPDTDSDTLDLSQYKSGDIAALCILSDLFSVQRSVY